ncbi:MAG: biotin synthase BioB [Candidatus Fimivivens sp.]|nr:biotin synthase BioB [Candidatus Fimivivens sp.]
MSIINELKDQVIAGGKISKQQAISLYHEELSQLCSAANHIRQHFCGNIFDICTIINAKSGRCSENCKYCAQSAHYKTECHEYPLLSQQEIVDGANYNAKQGVLRYSLVTSGRNLSDTEVDAVCKAVVQIKSMVPIQVCGSFGLLTEPQYRRLFEAGLTRIHNNLETSESHFANMCTTHTFNDKLDAIKSAKTAGMSVCSGGIFGIGESVDDRIALAFSIKELGIKSVPINLLNPVKGTPYQNNVPLTLEELCRIVAVYRFIMPDAFIRLAGGRGLLADKGKAAFISGANAAISGDMLTTSGITVETDLAMFKELGFEVKLRDE